MKRIIALSLVLLIVLSFCLVGCDKNKGEEGGTTEEATVLSEEPAESGEEPVESEPISDEVTGGEATPVESGTEAVVTEVVAA